MNDGGHLPTEPGHPAQPVTTDRAVLRVRDVRPGAACTGAPRVLLIAADRPFRDVVALLLERRGSAVTTTVSIGALDSLIEQERPDVAVIDASGSPAWATRAAVAVSAIDPGIGIVIADEGEPQCSKEGAHLSKWGSFQRLFEAVERAARQPTQTVGIASDRSVS